MTQRTRLSLLFAMSEASLREPSKLKSAKTWGKVPNRGGHQKFKKVPKFKLGKVKKEEGGYRKFKKFPSFSWEKFKKRGGSSHFKKVPSFQKLPSLKNNALFPSHEDP